MLRVETALCSAGRSCTVNTEPQPDHTTFFFIPPRQAQSGLLPLSWDYKGPLYWTLKGKRHGEGTHRARVTQQNSQGVEMMAWTESLTAFPLDYARGRPWPQSGT